MLDDYVKVIKHLKAFIAETEYIVGVLVPIQNSTGMLLDNVAVHPDQQGKGLGKRLINLAESETRASGYMKLDLYTHECMGENIELYKSPGYMETERKEELGCNRVYMPKYLNCRKRDDAL
jgi:ribosomal protein S18 acetylase RimI-like enzyme